MKSIEERGCCNNKPAQDDPSVNSCSFEFHRGSDIHNNRHQRMVFNSLSKPTPSKWDDAQKWLVGLSSEFNSNHGKPKPQISGVEDRILVGSVPPRAKDPNKSIAEGGECMKPITMNQNGEEMKKIDCGESLWQINEHGEDSLTSVRSVCVRDMGTEMTPIASQEPSRAGTPLRATTPVGRSPISSPDRFPQGSQGTQTHSVCTSSLQGRSDVALLGRATSTGWSTKEKRSDAYGVHMKKNVEGRIPNSLETRAIAWDEAERAKCMARYKREELKIQAWENHEKRRAEMEMKRMEIMAERLKSHAQEKLANKLASIQRRAEEKRVNAAAKMNELAMRTSERADYIRTGRLRMLFCSCKLPSCCW